MEIIPTYLYGPLVGIGMAGLCIAAIAYKKKKMALQYQASQELKQKEEEALYQKFKERLEREHAQKNNQTTS